MIRECRDGALGNRDRVSADAYLDPDGDGLSNFDEYPNGTDPQDADTDNGGEPDLSEAVNGRDGTDPGDDVTGITLVSVSPGEGDSRGGEQVLVLGSGFQNGATVDFGGAAASEVTFVNSTRLVVTTPAHSLGTVDVTVSNPGGGGASKAGAFAFLCEFVEPPVAFSNVGTPGLCAGKDVQLGASGISGATFSWTGPNGFTSNLQNPTISQPGRRGGEWHLYSDHADRELQPSGVDRRSRAPPAHCDRQRWSGDLPGEQCFDPGGSHGGAALDADMVRWIVAVQRRDEPRHAGGESHDGYDLLHHLDFGRLLRRHGLGIRRGHG